MIVAGSLGVVAIPEATLAGVEPASVGLAVVAGPGLIPEGTATGSWTFIGTAVGSTPNLAPPGTPTGLTVTPGDAQASHAFTAPVDVGDGITDYEIETVTV